MHVFLILLNYIHVNLHTYFKKHLQDDDHTMKLVNMSLLFHSFDPIKAGNYVSCFIHRVRYGGFGLKEWLVVTYFF